MPGPCRQWGVYDGKTNPVARSNVCPEIDPPAEPSFYAFCFTVAAQSSLPSFVVAGSGEAVEGKGNYRDHTVRFGETSPDAIAEKARYVLGEMERRAKLLGFAWADTPPRRSTPCTTCIRSSPTRSCAAAPRTRASHGITAGRRCATSNTRWIAARSRMSG